MQPAMPSLESKKFRYSIDGKVYAVTAHFIDESGEHIRLGDERKSISENPVSFKRYWEVLE
jgi:hypothetical protein